MKERRVWTKWFYWFTFAVAISLVYKTLDNFSSLGRWVAGFFHIIMPFIIGIIMSYVLYTPERNLEKLFIKIKKVKFFKKHARLLSVIIVYAILILILVLVINYLF